MLFVYSKPLHTATLVLTHCWMTRSAVVHATSVTGWREAVFLMAVSLNTSLPLFYEDCSTQRGRGEHPSAHLCICPHAEGAGVTSKQQEFVAKKACCVGRIFILLCTTLRNQVYICIRQFCLKLTIIVHFFS